MSQDNDDDNADFSAFDNKLPEETRAIELVPADYTKNDVLERDVQLVRDSLVTTVQTAQASLAKVLELADQSQNHLVYKAAAEFLNALVSSQKALADVTFERQKKVLQETNNTNVPQVINNNLHVHPMTTEEAMAMIRETLKSPKIIDGNTENGKTA